MQIGLLTGVFGGGKNVEEIATWAAKAGFQSLEVAGGPRGHIKPQDVQADDGCAVKRVLKETGLRISSFAIWQYAIPGYGDVPWGEYLRALRQAKYDGVLSIEHEDGAFGVEEGFERGLRCLRTL